MDNFLGDYGWHVIQLLTLIIVSFVSRSFKHLLDELRALRADVKAEHDRFKDYMQVEKCKLHREMIEKHIADSEARIAKMLSHCKHHVMDDDLK